MFGELPKLLGKEFAIGFFLPAIAILLTIFGVLQLSEVCTDLPDILARQDPLIGGTVALFSVWIVGIALMALNRTFIRTLEGYGSANPFRLLRWIQLRQFRKLVDRWVVLSEQQDLREASDQSTDPDWDTEFRDIRLRLAEEFPDDEDFVLPTKFGNVIRAFEVYPRVIYGLDAIPGWPRLIGVVPAEYRSHIEEAKSILDFWINLWAGAIVAFLLHVVLAIMDHSMLLLWVLLSATLAAIVAATLARRAAAQWGALVKSAFDLFRGDLLKKLGFEQPRSIEAERELWQAVGHAATYRSVSAANKFTRFRPRNPQT
jgi:hypothetical protein